MLLRFPTKLRNRICDFTFYTASFERGSAGEFKVINTGEAFHQSSAQLRH